MRQTLRAKLNAFLMLYLKKRVIHPILIATNLSKQTTLESNLINCHV